MSKIYDAAIAYRKQIDANEMSLLKEMANRWALVTREMRGEYMSTINAIKEAMLQGAEIHPGWLYSQQRYREMMVQSQSLARAYATGVSGLIRSMEEKNALLGLEESAELIHIAAPDSVAWTKVTPAGMNAMAGFLADGSPLKSLIQEAAESAAQEVENALLIGIATGQGSNTIAYNMEKAANIPYERSIRIARTEINRAYRAAVNEQYKATNGVIAGYRRLCFKPTACFACLMLDGELYPLSTPLEDHPNGKCTSIPVTRSELERNASPEWQTGQEWFMEQDPETQRQLMGAGRFDLWESGQVDLQDMVFIKDNPIWGGSPTMRTLESLKNDEIKINRNAYISIIERNPANGNPAGVTFFGGKLSRHQRELLDTLPTYDSKVEVKKSAVSMVDLAAMTAESGVEFAMFTRQGKRLIIRGDAESINIGIKQAQELSAMGYRWSGHTHPGFDDISVLASDGDRIVLNCFEQENSVIYNAAGHYTVFSKDE